MPSGTPTGPHTGQGSNYRGRLPRCMLLYQSLLNPSMFQLPHLSNRGDTLPPHKVPGTHIQLILSLHLSEN